MINKKRNAGIRQVTVAPLSESRAAPALRRFPGLLFLFYFILFSLASPPHTGPWRDREDTGNKTHSAGGAFGFRAAAAPTGLLALRSGRCVTEFNIHKTGRGIPFRLGEPRGPLPLFSWGVGGESSQTAVGQFFFFPSSSFLLLPFQ